MVATADLTAEIAGSVNEVIRDRAIRHAIFMERLKTREVSRIVRILNDDVLPDLTANYQRRLQRITTRGFDASVRSTQRLREMIAVNRETLRVGIRSASTKLRSDLHEIAITESEFQRKILSDSTAGLPIRLEFQAPSASVLRSVVTSRPFQGRFLQEHWVTIDRLTQGQIKQQLNIGLVQGESVPQMVSRIQGVWGTLRRHVETLVRTSSTHVLTQAREETYRENGDIIKGVQWISTLDAKTTDICAALDGRVFGIGKGMRPPAHPRCRSDTTPVLKSFEEMGIKGLKDLPPASRESMNGLVPAKLNYQGWLERMDARKATRHIVDDALGRERAKLFRKGVPVTKFVDSKFQSLTLDQIRVREGLAA